MNRNNKTHFQKYVGKSEEEMLRKEKQTTQNYKAGDEKYKQEYWNDYFVKGLLPLWSIEYPINIVNFRDSIKDLELSIEKFIPGIMKAIEDFTGEEGLEIEHIFTLDEQAKTTLKELKIQRNISRNSQEINKVIHPNEKLKRILGTRKVNISYEELIERIGDLYYDSLSSFLLELGNNISNKEVSGLLKEASTHITKAWEICLPYVKHDFTKMKHTKEIKGLDINKEEIAKNISTLDKSDIGDFLKALSLKIQKDGEADQKRGRTQLSTELFAATDRIKEAGNITS